MTHNLRRKGIALAAAAASVVTPITIATIAAPAANAQTCTTGAASKITLRANLAHEFGVGTLSRLQGSRTDAVNRLNKNDHVDSGIYDAIDKLVGTGLEVNYSVFSDTNYDFFKDGRWGATIGSWKPGRITYSTESVKLYTKEDATKLKGLIKAKHIEAINKSGSENGGYGASGTGPSFGKAPNNQTIDFHKNWIKSDGSANPGANDPAGDGIGNQDRIVINGINSAKKLAASNPIAGQVCPTYPNSTAVKAGGTTTVKVTKSIASAKYAFAGKVPSYITINANTGEITAKPGADVKDVTTTVPVKVTYTDGSSDSISTKIAVTGKMNGKYNPSYPATTAPVGKTTTVAIKDLPAGSKVAKTGGAAWATVDANTGRLTLTPKATDKDASVGIRVTYPDGSTDTLSVPIKVSSQAGSIDPKYPAIMGTTTKTTTVSPTTALPKGTKVTKTSGPAWITVDPAGKLTLAPKKATDPTDNLVLKVTYPDGSSDTLKLNTDFKTAADVTTSAYADTTVQAGKTATQALKAAAPAGTTFKLDSSAPSWASVDSKGTLTLKPGATTKADNFTIKVVETYADGSSDTVSAKVTVTAAVTSKPTTSKPATPPTSKPATPPTSKPATPPTTKPTTSKPATTTTPKDDVTTTPEEDTTTTPAVETTEPSSEVTPPQVDPTVDTDKDEVPDAVENQQGTDPNDDKSFQDSDKDGVPDYVEEKEGTNPNDPADYLDSDKDGVPDYVERHDGTDPNNASDFKDSDKDGVPDYIENRDGTDPNNAADFKDTDKDGVPDYVEGRDGTDPNDPNSFKDSDKDGVPDYVEERDGTDPNDPKSFKDSDKDGVPDYVEERDGTDPNDPKSYKDTDKDGVPDYVEAIDGTDPNDPKSFKDTDKDGIPDYLDTDPSTPAKTTADQVTPVLENDGKVSVEPGKSVTVPAPKGDDGQALPEGTKLELSSDTPSWITLDSNGNIIVAPGSDVKPGDYPYTLKVVYPDGSVDTISGVVTVSGATGTDAKSSDKGSRSLANTGADVQVLLGGAAALITLAGGAFFAARRKN